MQDYLTKAKKDFLSKKDKSKKGHLDRDIINLDSAKKFPNLTRKNMEWN